MCRSTKSKLCRVGIQKVNMNKFIGNAIWSTWHFPSQNYKFLVGIKTKCVLIVYCDLNYDSHAYMDFLHLQIHIHVDMHNAIWWLTYIIVGK